jgi:chorismate dehydratase
MTTSFHKKGLRAHLLLFATDNACTTLHSGDISKSLFALSRGEELILKTIRIGAPGYISARPLIYGLMQQPRTDVILTYDEPSDLAEALERGSLDVALIPSIEFLRGTGKHYVNGPAVVVNARTNGLVLVTDRPITEIRRVAVAEKCRTTLAAMRIVLDGLYNVLPDFCVFKGESEEWRNNYDAVLLDGDNGIRYCDKQLRENEECHDIAEMWSKLFPHPLVLSLWAYNDLGLSDRLSELLGKSRDFGVQNLSILADGVARTSQYKSAFLYDYFASGWTYNTGEEEEQGLRLLEDHALRYQLIQNPRLERVLQRQI